MVDLSNKTIQKIFHEQVRQLTTNTLISKEETFDFQMSGGWIA